MVTVQGRVRKSSQYGLSIMLFFVTGYLLGGNREALPFKIEQIRNSITGELKTGGNQNVSKPDLAAKTSLSQETTNHEEYLKTVPACQKAIVFTSPRHGSTWLIDNINRCAFSRAKGRTGNGKFDEYVFVKTELWNRIGHKMNADHALKYIEANYSVKIFVESIRRPEVEERVWELVQKHHSKNYPVLILRRNPLDVFKSLKTAISTGQWRTHGMKTSKEVAKLPLLLLNEFAEQLNKDFANVEDRLKSMGIPYSVLHYEDMLGKPATVAHEVGCKIEVCATRA